MSRGRECARRRGRAGDRAAGSGRRPAASLRFDTPPPVPVNPPAMHITATRIVGPGAADFSARKHDCRTGARA